MKHIFLVEDNVDNAEMLRHVLQSTGYAVTSCQDGATMLKTLESDAKFDVVLMDLYLTDGPSLDRVPTTMAIPPIIVMSAVTQNELNATEGHPCVLATLRKPFCLNEFLGLVKSVTH